MPVDPVTRAQFRLALFRIETDWYQFAEQFDNDGDRKLASKSRKMLRESILASVDLFAAKQYFLSDDFSLVDSSIAPILWRLPVYGIELGSQAEPIEMYMKRVFERRSFQESLTELEQEMRL
jgi:RNA polymerase-associated protein